MIPRQTKKTIFITATVVIIMFAFSFAIVPIYNRYCRIAGLNTALPSLAAPDMSRKILVQFVATNNQNLAWDFYPLQNSVNVYPDENKKVFFYVKNNSQHTMTVQAIPSMTPEKALNYFHKIECFCFRQQTLKAGESLKMPLVFRIDKELPIDLSTMTLGYTLFDVTRQQKSKGPG